MATLNIEIEIPDRKDFDTDKLRQCIMEYAQRMTALLEKKKPYVADMPLYISERIKAMETGFVCPENLSDDYKEEIHSFHKKQGA